MDSRVISSSSLSDSSAGLASAVDTDVSTATGSGARALPHEIPLFAGPNFFLAYSNALDSLQLHTSTVLVSQLPRVELAEAREFLLTVEWLLGVEVVPEQVLLLVYIKISS
jgi:hypothetical protein